ncbi:hypothetical protein LIER_28609 [Lithospermum erythrorhizon]|uniref:Uncharacterized protein n=1 Tax=Lithospermum erythrorhizon TaxID=34254 RepID=A0AAV3RM86_LITER
MVSCNFSEASEKKVHEGANIPGNDFDFDDICNRIEGFEESISSCVNSPISADDKIANTGNGIKYMNDLDSPGKSGSLSPSSSCKQEENRHSVPANKYLSIQEAYNNSSTVAYHLIGGLLTKFAEVGGLDLDQDNLSYLQKTSIGSSESELLSQENVDNYCSLISVLEEQTQIKIMCSLPDSAMEKLKKIMS